MKNLKLQLLLLFLLFTAISISAQTKLIPFAGIAHGKNVGKLGISQYGFSTGLRIEKQISNKYFLESGIDLTIFKKNEKSESFLDIPPTELEINYTELSVPILLKRKFRIRMNPKTYKKRLFPTSFVSTYFLGYAPTFRLPSKYKLSFITDEPNHYLQDTDERISYEYFNTIILGFDMHKKLGNNFGIGLNCSYKYQFLNFEDIKLSRIQNNLHTQQFLIQVRGTYLL